MSSDVDAGWQAGDLVDIKSEGGMEYGAVIVGPAEDGDPAELRVRLSDGTLHDWEVAEFREPTYLKAGGRDWRVGEIVDVETEDGLEKGARIMGPSKSKDPLAVQIVFADGVVDDWEVEDFVRPLAGGASGMAATEMPEVLFQGWLQKKAGATNKSKGKAALKAAAVGWDKRWFEVRSRNGGQFGTRPFQGASVRWLTTIKAAKPQKELALAGATLFLAEHMTSGFTLSCPTGDQTDAASEVTIAPIKGGEVKFSQFVEALIDGGVQVGGGQYPYPAREQCAIFVQPKGSLQCELRAPLDSETNGGFVVKKGAPAVKLGAKLKLVKTTNDGGAFLEGRVQPKAAMWLVTIQGKLVAPLTWELIQLRLIQLRYNSAVGGARPLELMFSA